MNRYLLTPVAILLLAVFAMLPGLVCASETGAIILRSSVKVKAAWVGQRVDLQLEVLARDGWAQIKMARDFEVTGAYLVRLETQGTRLSESISGYEYSGQQYELSLFPQQGGRFTVPQIPVDVEVSRWGAQAGKSSVRMKTPSVVFDVKVPPGAENLSGLISTAQLQAGQQWDPNLGKFKVGDAIKRTIERGAPDVSGMAFVPLLFPATDGLGIYPGEPSVEDNYSRGSLTGKRTESVTYVFEKAGSYELPEVIIPWWDIRQEKLHRVVLPVKMIEVSAVPGTAESETTAVAQTTAGRSLRISQWLVFLVLLLVMAAGLAWRFREVLQSRWQERQAERRESEETYFQRMTDACRQNDAQQAYNHLLLWLHRLHSGSETVTLGQFLHEMNSEPLSRAVAELEQKLFKKTTGPSVETTWSGQELSREMTRCRKTIITSKRKGGHDKDALVPLNPGLGSGE